MKSLRYKFNNVIYAHKFYCKRRYKRILYIGIEFMDWMSILINSRGKCIRCEEHVGLENLSTDLIIPLRRDGELTLLNIQFLCRKCNSKKHTKRDDYISKMLLKEKYFILSKEEILNKKFSYLIDITRKYIPKNKNIIRRILTDDNDYKMVVDAWAEDEYIRSGRIGMYDRYVERMWLELQEKKRLELEQESLLYLSGQKSLRGYIE